jgi:HTH-type transcriptional regulator/antitoxin HipB
MTQIARTPKQLGAILKRQRNSLGLTQSEAAARAGLRQEHVSKIESGLPGTAIRAIMDLVAALDLELAVAPRRKGGDIDLADIF